MTAKEMFEKLGYWFYMSPSKRYIEYRTQKRRITHDKIESKLPSINFDMKDKSFHVCDFETMSPMVTVEIYLAITQQMKELGWIE